MAKITTACHILSSIHGNLKRQEVSVLKFPCQVIASIYLRVKLDVVLGLFGVYFELLLLVYVYNLRT